MNFSILFSDWGYGSEYAQGTLLYYSKEISVADINHLISLHIARKFKSSLQWPYKKGESYSIQQDYRSFRIVLNEAHEYTKFYMNH